MDNKKEACTGEEQKKMKENKEGQKENSLSAMGYQALREEEDQCRRFRDMMETLDAQGKLTEEEKEQVFGEGGYLQQDESRLAAMRESVLMSGHQEEEEGKPPKKHFGSRKLRLNLVKAASIVCIFGVGIFAASMNSQGDRDYIADTIDISRGENIDAEMNAGKSIVLRNISEEEAVEKIETMFQAELPIFQYKPEFMEFDKAEIYEEREIAILHYTIHNKKFLLYISANENFNKSRDAEGRDDSDYPLSIDYYNINVRVYNTSDEKEEESVICGKWKYQQAYYQVMTNLPKEEFDKIIKKM